MLLGLDRKMWFFELIVTCVFTYVRMNVIKYVCMYVCVHWRVIQKVMSHPERRSEVEHFYCGNGQPLLIKLEKLIQISVLISVQMKPLQRLEVYNKSKILVRLRTFSMALACMYVCMYVCAFSYEVCFFFHPLEAFIFLLCLPLAHFFLLGPTCFFLLHLSLMSSTFFITLLIQVIHLRFNNRSCHRK